MPLKTCCSGVLQLAIQIPLSFIYCRSDSSTSSFHNPTSIQMTWAPSKSRVNYCLSESESFSSPSRVTPSPEPLLPEVPVIVEAWTQINQIPGSAAVPLSTVHKRNNRYLDLLFFKCALQVGIQLSPLIGSCPLIR